ncbi:unnamed protein product [Spirodela intermedia]|uniref:Uncharacterized protein n=1 Tax=Spirodela intermedia TaxID=51605 RepID=A0A7I8KIK3_SPIIN|nr:unnamed protein product [Spirodela intermedia]
MAKGDDAVARKRNRAQRRKGRSLKSKESVSSRVAAIIAAKRRRKTGKRRICEGMCFTLPTPEDPFNDLNDPVAKKEMQMSTDLCQRQKEAASLLRKSNGRKKPVLPVPSKPSSAANGLRHQIGKGEGGADVDSDDRVSKYLILCLKAIQEASSLDWEMGETDDLDQVGTGQQSPLLACKWGIDFWKSRLSGLDIVDSTGDCASREQIAWLVSIASDIIARKEKEGLLVPSPFLVLLVPSQDKASEVRSLCKPLKALGVHTVSLHPGALLDHQVHGLRSCEPEFIVSTPDRLLSLVSMGALDVSGVSLLVLDGLGSLIASGYADDIKSIRGHISGDPQTVVFGDEHKGCSSGLLLKLVKEPARRLPLNSLLGSGAAVDSS